MLIGVVLFPDGSRRVVYGRSIATVELGSKGLSDWVAVAVNITPMVAGMHVR